ESREPEGQLFEAEPVRVVDVQRRVIDELGRMLLQREVPRQLAQREARPGDRRQATGFARARSAVVGVDRLAMDRPDDARAEARVGPAANLDLDQPVVGGPARTGDGWRPTDARFRLAPLAIGASFMIGLTWHQHSRRGVSRATPPAPSLPELPARGD